MDYRLQGDRFRPGKKKKEKKEEHSSPIPVFGPYQVELTVDAEANFNKLPGNVKTSMEEIFDRLRAWPEVSGAKTLFGKGYAPNKYRMKTWDWRVEFTVDEKNREVTVNRIGHRDSFYDEYH